MVGDQTMIVAGIGCRRGCPAEDIVALVREAETRTEAVDALAAPAFKRDEPGLREAAAIGAAGALLLPRIASARATCAIGRWP